MTHERIDPSLELEKRFLDLGSFYEIPATREQGEKMLARIAETATREYQWVFDAEKEIWLHYPTAAVIDELDADKGSAKKGLTIPPELLHARSRNASHYHIHPDILVSMMINLEVPGGNSRDFLEVSGQIPSSAGGDMVAASRLIQGGYKDIRIVTRRGTTLLKFDPSKLHYGKNAVTGLTFQKEDLYEFLKSGFNEAVFKIFEKLNQHYQGVFTYEFIPRGSR